jgi:hypothetical protein
MGTKPKIRISRFFPGCLTKIIKKRGEVSLEVRIDKVMQNGGYWLSIVKAAGHKNGTSFAQIEMPGHL